MKVQNRYLVVFTQSFEDFRLPELLSICELYDVELVRESYSHSHPYCIVTAGSHADIHTILSRYTPQMFSAMVIRGDGGATSTFSEKSKNTYINGKCLETFYILISSPRKKNLDFFSNLLLIDF